MAYTHRRAWGLNFFRNRLEWDVRDSQQHREESKRHLNRKELLNGKKAGKEMTERERERFE
jgi:hypothetical protein